MANATRNQLDKAYNLIQQDRLEEAIAILRPITGADPDNINAWWLLANAVSEPDDAYNALKNVVRLDPNHAEASDMLVQLEREFPELSQGAAVSSFGDDAPTFDDLFREQPTASSGGAFSSDDLEGLFQEEPASSSSMAPDSYSGLFDSPEPASSSPSDFSNLFDNQNTDAIDNILDGVDDPFAGTQTPSFIESEAAAAPAGKPARGKAAPKPRREKAPRPVKEPSAPADPLMLESRANRRPVFTRVLIFLLVIVALAAAGLYGAYTLGLIGRPTPPPAVTTTLNDSLTKVGYQGVGSGITGDKLEVTFCEYAGPKLRSKILNAMDVVAESAATVRTTVKSATMRIVNCGDTTQTLYVATSPIDAINAYVDGGKKDTRQFRASWVQSQ